MKNTITAFVSLLLISVLASGCSSDPRDIKLSDLKSACDYVDAAEKVLDAAIAIGDNKDLEKLTEADKKEIKELEDKMEEIGKAAEKKYTEAEVMECKSFERVKEKVDAAEKVFDAN